MDDNDYNKHISTIYHNFNDYYIFNHNHDCYRIDFERLKHIAPVLEKNSESIITKISLKKNAAFAESARAAFLK